MWNLNWVAGTCIIVILWMTSFSESAEPVDYLRDVKPILSSRRTPTDAERQRCLRFLSEHAELLKDTQSLKEFPAGPKVEVPAAANPKQRARENLIHALFNHNDFITIR